MPYVPPHLRSSGGTTAAEQPRVSTGYSRSSSGSADYGGSFNSRRRDDRDAQPAPASKRPSGATTVDRSNSVAVKASAWKPSDRVLQMTEEQIAESRQRLNISVEGESASSSSVAPIESFADMNLDATIMTDIKARDYDKPTPIQCQGVPVALYGKDILGCAETGSGKTASFALPMIQHCINQEKLRRGDGPMALVLAPTRELAQQIDREVKAFSRSSKTRSAIVVGGVHMGDQRSELRQGVEIVVATPGRFIDHLQQGNTSLNRVSFIVLDEADRMLDMGFEPQIKEVMTQVPKEHQTLLFSATMPEEIEALANAYLRDPFRVKVGQVSTPTANVSQHLQKTTDTSKLEDISTLLLQESAQAEANGHSLPLTIVFVERKARCDEVAEALQLADLEAAALHGGLTQGDRNAALADFTVGKIKVLVATDVASRGLDIKGIGHVINLDLPRTFEDYVHRIGRTGRAGSTGRATSFYTDRDSFLVSQIKKALHDMETGNGFAFVSGKAARQKERELALEFKSKAKLNAAGMMDAGTGQAVKLDEKYRFMANADATKSGAADDAWDD